MSASIGIRVGTLPEVPADLTGPLGIRVGTLPEVPADLTGPLGDTLRRWFPESITIAQRGNSLREIRDTRGVSQEAMAGIAPESWLEWGPGAEGDLAPRPPEADMLTAHDATSTNSRKVQQKLGKLVNQRRHAACAASLEELPETARPTGPADPMSGSEVEAPYQARCRSLQGAGARHAFGRDQRTHSGSYSQKRLWAWEGGSLG